VGWVINWVDQLRTRLSIKLFLATFLTLFILFWLSFSIARALIPELYIRQFTTRFEAFVIDFGNEISDLSLEEIKIEIDHFAAYNNAHVTLSTADHSEIIYTVNAMTILDSASPLIDIYRIFRQDPITGTRFAISAQTHLESMMQINEILEQIFHFLLLGNTVVSLIVAYLFSSSVSEPIVELTQIAKKLERLELSEFGGIKRADEIGMLSNHLNSMARKLDLTLTDLQAANSMLQESVDFKQQQEEQRSQLFTALSHELKTPLFVLKGELEGMIKNISPYHDRDVYLQKSYETTETMEKLIQEILLVSRLESNEISLKLDQLNMSQLVYETCQNYEGVGTIKGVSLLYYCDDDLMIHGDRFQIQNVLSNVTNNAIFHSAVDEVVWIQFEKQGSNGILTVKNKGTIPGADLSHVFAPFYRLDRSRSRHSGGSGLGLFIVKSILDLHQFQYSLTNDQEFVVFTVEFPLIFTEGSS